MIRDPEDRLFPTLEPSWVIDATTMIRVSFIIVILQLQAFGVVATPVDLLVSSPSESANTTSLDVDPPRNILCDQDFGGWGAKPDYDDCAQAVSQLPRGAYI